jgi:hypothetical protein
MRHFLSVLREFSLCWFACKWESGEKGGYVKCCCLLKIQVLHDTWHLLGGPLTVTLLVQSHS